MFVVLETCSLGIGPSPDGGITIKVSDIPALPHLSLGIPIGAEAASAILDEGLKIMHKPKVFGLDDLRKEVAYDEGSPDQAS